MGCLQATDREETSSSRDDWSLVGVTRHVPHLHFFNHPRLWTKKAVGLVEVDSIMFLHGMTFRFIHQCYVGLVSMLCLSRTMSNRDSIMMLQCLEPCMSSSF